MSIDTGSVRAGFLSEKEMAAELGHTVRTLARWRDLGVGPPHVKLGRFPVYSVEAARAWLAAGGTNAPRQERKRRKARR